MQITTRNSTYSVIINEGLILVIKITSDSKGEVVVDQPHIGDDITIKIGAPLELKHGGRLTLRTTEIKGLA
jgi:hypothetical protein